MRMRTGYRRRSRLYGLVFVATLAAEAWSATGAVAQEAVVGTPIRAGHINALRADVEAQFPECSSVLGAALLHRELSHSVIRIYTNGHSFVGAL